MFVDCHPERSEGSRYFLPVHTGMLRFAQHDIGTWSYDDYFRYGAQGAQSRDNRASSSSVERTATPILVISISSRSVKPEIASRTRTMRKSLSLASMTDVRGQFGKLQPVNIVVVTPSL